MNVIDLRKIMLEAGVLINSFTKRSIKQCANL